MLSLTFILSNTINAQVIVIDPGHGGEDTGAKTSFKGELVQEKDLSLIYSKLLYKELKRDYSVYLSRSIDRTVGLNERAELNEKVNADLFLSIHLNSAHGQAANGFEIYYLDNHDDLAVKKIEDEENRSFLDEDKSIDKILLDLIIQKSVVKSRKLANLVHKSLKHGVIKQYKMKDRGVKPGLFYVLAKAQRPSILIEVGFMSSPLEMNRLLNKNFQKSFVLGLKKGIKEYLKAELKRKKNEISIL